MTVGSGAYDGPYSFLSRFDDSTCTNPEELIAAAHAGCFSMALSSGLGKGGITPTRISTEVKVHLEKVGQGLSITKIDVVTEGEVPGTDEATFLDYVEAARKGCPVSRALGGVEITLSAGHTGAVSLVQGFGSALNLNVHFRLLFLDGVYLADGAVPPVFRVVSEPGAKELQALVEQIALRSGRALWRGSGE